MVYFPCLHITDHISFASRANVHIRFRNDLPVPHLETVTACTPVIYLACAYPAPQGLLASRTNILETQGFRICCICPHLFRHAGILLLSAARFCLCICRPFSSVVFFTLLCLRWRFLHVGDILFSFPFSFLGGSPAIRQAHPLLRPVAVFLFATHILRPFCGLFCSIVLSALCRSRLCFPPFLAVLVSTPFSCRNGCPDIGDGTCLFRVRRLFRYFCLRCSYPLHCFADAFPRNR